MGLSKPKKFRVHEVEHTNDDGMENRATVLVRLDMQISSDKNCMIHFCEFRKPNTVRVKSFRTPARSPARLMRKRPLDFTLKRVLNVGQF